MTTQSDLDQAVGAWFSIVAAPAAPSEPLARVLETTRGRRPRGALLARVGSGWVGGGSMSRIRDRLAALRPAFQVALVGLLAVAIVGSAVLVGSRLAAPVATPVPSTAPSEVLATAEPSPGIRPSLPPDAPTIADPYWLLAGGPDTFDILDADGLVAQTTKGETYRVLEGGAMEGTILVNGIDRAIVSVYTTTGKEPIPGIDPIETQYGAQIDDVLPDPSLPLPSHTPDDPDVWTRSTQTRGDVTVYVRTTDVLPGGGADAYWWGDEDAGQWFVLSLQPGEDGFEDILTALLGPAE